MATKLKQSTQRIDTRLTNFNGKIVPPLHNLLQPSGGLKRETRQICGCRVPLGNWEIEWDQFACRRRKAGISS
jgi:hypothetical protein